MQRAVKKIIEDIAEEMNLPIDVVTTAVESAYKCARKEIATADVDDVESFKNVRFKGLGLLVADQRKIKAIQYARNTRSDKTVKESGDAGSIPD